MAEKFTIVACPTCGKDVEWRPESLWRPFCSERCKLIDLGEWSTEKYRVPAESSEDLSESGEI
ncbi:MAG TPA: DNA gyrase inhibitor YacG [Thiobacillaceae bacterium]|nr:DNA gyrase inhibitor YacG [Thiobacillaceae bacterium]